MSDPDASDAPHVIERSVDNLSAIIRAVLPGGQIRAVHSGPVDALVALIALLLVEVLAYVITVSREVPSYWELRGFAGALVFHVLVVCLVTVAMRRASDLGTIIVGFLWALILGQVLALLVAFVVSADTLIEWMLGYALPALVPPMLFLLSVLGPIGGLVAGAGIVVSLGIIVLEWNGATFWGKESGEIAAGSLVDTEAVYAAQPELLRSQTDRLRPGNPDAIELFSLLGAGYPYERVFQREVAKVGELLETEFEARSRVVRLVNTVHAPMSFPLLNRTNLQTALSEISRAMNPDDLFWMFLTSHGNSGVFATEFAGVMTRNLSPSDIGAALNASGIQNAVIVVSACYSGSFVEALQGPNRLVLTAAGADRASFGCSDQAEWTNWGRAFFVEALTKTRDPRVAAEIARELVSDWEMKEGFPPSDPQIVEGAAVGNTIERWLETLR